MSATSNSAPDLAHKDWPSPPDSRPASLRLVLRGQPRVIIAGVVTLVFAFTGIVRVFGEAPMVDRAKATAVRLYAEALADHHAAPNDAKAGWHCGRACFDWAEFATNDTERAQIAEQGIAACRLSVAREAKSAPGHYYLAMNLGQLARTRSLGALKIVGEMEREFKTARDQDERFHFAGPDRNLGQLYLEAPGWPTSIGSRSKARQHLQRAVQLAPGYPENRLNLMEAFLKWNDHTGGRRELAALDALWPTARTNFLGEAWELSWADWDARLKKARKKIAEQAQPIASPRNKG
jgi:hypothetical protein